MRRLLRVSMSSTPLSSLSPATAASASTATTLPLSGVAYASTSASATLSGVGTGSKFTGDVKSLFKGAGHADLYARFRPTYPPALYAAILDYMGGIPRDVAVDIATGSGALPTSGPLLLTCARCVRIAGAAGAHVEVPRWHLRAMACRRERRGRGGGLCARTVYLWDTPIFCRSSLESSVPGHCS